MSAPLLSAAMIVRDESMHLAACLESIEDVVDEIVIVDTGSIDDTVEIARSFGATVELVPWDGSFAEPRNLSLELARGRWILYIDADERLAPVDATRFRARLETAEEVALRLRLRALQGSTPYWEYRLWRSDPRIRFDGRMHEKMTPAIARVAREDGRPIGECELSLDHVGYEGDQTHKHRRNLSLLQARLAEDPDDPYNWRHLSQVLGGLGDEVQSDAALERAVALARTNQTDVGAAAFSELIGRRRELGHDVADLLDEAVGRYPDSFAIAWQKVNYEIDAERYDQALWWLERFDVDPTLPVEDTVGYAADLFLVQVPEARGLCLLKLGRHADAAAAYRQAEEHRPEDDSHRVRRLLAEHLAEKAQRESGRVQPDPAVSTPAPRSSDAAQWSARELYAGLTIDIAGVPVQLRASDAMRGLALRALLGATKPTDAEPVASLSFTRHRIAPPEREPDQSFDEVRVWHDDVLHATHGDELGARVTTGGAAIGGWDRNLGRAFRQLGPFMLARLLAPHDRYLLHGAAIRRGAEAVMVLGRSEAGKSTLVLGALKDGWSVLADDLVIIHPDREGSRVTGLPRPLLVPTEVVHEPASMAPPGNGTRLRVELSFNDWDRDTVPVTAVVVVGHGGQSRPVTTPLEHPELLRIFVSSMFSGHRTHVRRWVPTAIRLAALPACRLLHAEPPEGRAAQGAEALSRWLSESADGAGGGRRHVRYH